MLEWGYSILFKLSKVKKDNTVIFKLYRKIIKVLINIIYPLYYKFIPTKKVGVDITNEDNVIVSLTSFPERINNVWICLETLLRQKTRPNKIILWLAESQFEGIESLPRKIIRMQDRGLTIRFCDDLRPHKKYYYTMLENPDANVIVVDDDMFYPNNLITNLIHTAKKYPNTICCNRGHIITFNNGQVCSYEDWERKSNEEEPRLELCPTGCGGVLYPPNSLYNDVFNKEDIKELCLNADDLWLKVMSLLRGTKAVKTDKDMIGFIDIIETQRIKLTNQNVGHNMNDVQLRNILNKYEIELRELI